MRATGLLGHLSGVVAITAYATQWKRLGVSRSLMQARWHTCSESWVILFIARLFTVDIKSGTWGLACWDPPPSSAWVTKRSLSFISIASFGQALWRVIGLFDNDSAETTLWGWIRWKGGGDPDKSENKNKARINKLNKWGKRNNKEWGNKGYNGETLKALVKWKFYNLCVHMHVNRQEHACLCVGVCVIISDCK